MQKEMVTKRERVLKKGKGNTKKRKGNKNK